MLLIEVPDISSWLWNQLGIVSMKVGPKECKRRTMNHFCLIALCYRRENRGKLSLCYILWRVLDWGTSKFPLLFVSAWLCILQTKLAFVLDFFLIHFRTNLSNFPNSDTSGTVFAFSGIPYMLLRNILQGLVQTLSLMGKCYIGEMFGQSSTFPGCICKSFDILAS